MKRIDYTIILLNNDHDRLLTAVTSILKQDYELERIEIIILTTKLSKDIKDELDKVKGNLIIKEYKKYNLIMMYNDAIKVSKGKYLQFSNSNITYESSNALKEIKEKLIDNKIVSTNMLVINPINNKKTRYLLASSKEELIDLKETPEAINLCLESYFIDHTLLKGITFSKDFGIEARIKLIVDLYTKEQKYYNLGNINLISAEVYEDNSTSPLQYFSEWYDKSIINWIGYLKSQKKISHTVEEIMLYLLFIKFKHNLNSEYKYESDTLFSHIKELIHYIDVTTLFNKDYKRRFMITREEKAFLYHLSDNKGDLPIDLEEEHISVYAINYEQGKLLFDCSVNLMDYITPNKFKILIRYCDEDIKITPTKVYSCTKIFNQIINEKYTFKFSIDIKRFGNLEAFFVYDNQEYKLKFDFIKLQSRLDNNKYSYWKEAGLVIRNKVDKIIIEKDNLLKIFSYEIKYLYTNIKKESNKKRMIKLCLLRILYHITRPYYKHKHIWITYDKLYKGGDNGEYLYSYGLENNKNIYYIIKKDTGDYKRLIQNPYNKVLIFNTLKAKLYCLHAEVILKTHAGVLGYCGFDGVARNIVRGIFNAHIIEVQHGLTIQDIPQYQNRLVDNIRLYCIASIFEKKNIMKPEYDFAGDAIKLTGLARYDGLKNNDQRIILIAPTWRQSLALPAISHGVQRGYNDAFKKSEYYKIYNTLLNDKRLLASAKKNNYRIMYVIHPTLATQIDDFEKNNTVDIIAAGGDMSYEKILCEASLMVTDYSGIQYDFAYMRKPLIYFHPKELPPHYNNGSINYKKDGFGPITTTIDELVANLCKSMDDGCKNTEQYIKRADKFFKYDDYHNAKRIIETVEEYLDK